MPPITYSNNDMLDFSAAFGSFHVKSSSTSFVNSLMTVCGLPFILTVTFRRSTILTVSCLSVRWYTDHKYWSMQTSRTTHSSRVSVELTAPLASGGVSGASACEGSANDASRISAELTASLASLCSWSSVPKAPYRRPGAPTDQDCPEWDAAAEFCCGQNQAPWSSPVPPHRSRRHRDRVRARRNAPLTEFVSGQNSLLTLVNQYDALLGQIAFNWYKAALTYCGPYLVSTYGAVTAKW